jgi:hypothetical protein
MERNNNPFRIFISHTVEDRHLAVALANELSKHFSQLEFLTYGFPTNASWRSEPTALVKQADMMLVLYPGLDYRDINAFEVGLFASHFDWDRPVICIHPADSDPPLYLGRIETVRAPEDHISDFLRHRFGAQLRQGQDPLNRELAADQRKPRSVSITLASLFSVPVDRSLLFVVASFRDDIKAAFAGIEAAATKCGLLAQRGKEVLCDFRITDQIMAMILRAQYVVADLSYARPKIYFELGFARGRGKTVFTVARKGTPTHFDVSDRSCFFYEDPRHLESELIRRIKA